jgi:hypothetical protein
MANEVRYAISVTPVEELTDANASTHCVIASEVGKSLGGDGTAAVGAFDGTAANQGYLNATVNYLEVTDDAAVAVGADADAKFVFLKHSGYKFSSATALGAAATNSVKITIGASDEFLSILDAGECVVLKDDNGGLNCTTLKAQVVTSAGAAVSDEHIALEYLVVD